MRACSGGLHRRKACIFRSSIQFMQGSPSIMAKYDTAQLGKASSIPNSPEEATLDRVPNPHPGTDYVARFTCPEFTSICPVTGQPDFGILVIDYVPDEWLVESKSLKLYLTSFRNHGAFHEDCTVGIAKRLVVSERTVEAHVRHVLMKLDLPESDDTHRRVLAVLAALEAAQATLVYARDVLFMRRVVAIATPSNAASIKLLQAVGLVFEGNTTLPKSDETLALYGISFRAGLPT